MKSNQIIGGAGYTGGELIRVLVIIPMRVSFIHSLQCCKFIVYTRPGDNRYPFTDEQWSIDVLFLCLGMASQKFIAENKISDKLKLDLAMISAVGKDRTNDQQEPAIRLPELNKEQIHSTACVNGVFAIQRLATFSKSRVAGEYTTGITGSTGAGQSLSATSHFSWRANNIQAYKTLTHQLW
jgi:N-acetyl-gamma-glutamyl-phosphate reductase